MKFIPFFLFIFCSLSSRAEGQSDSVGFKVDTYINAKNHKGYITSSGNPGEGAIFSIYLPVED